MKFSQVNVSLECTRFGRKLAEHTQQLSPPRKITRAKGGKSQENRLHFEKIMFQDEKEKNKGESKDIEKKVEHERP